MGKEKRIDKSEEVFTQTKDDENNRIGKSEEKLGQDFDLVKITFRQNRKFHLHLGRNVYTFLGRESKEIPRILLDHKGFTDEIKKYFVIHNKEIN